MVQLFRRLAFLAGVTLLAVPLYLTEVARADDNDVLQAAWREGMAFEQKGDYRGAARAYERVLALAPQVFGPGPEDQTAIASTLNNLARMYWATGDYAKAEPLYQRSLKIREAQFGPDHLRVADSLNNLATLYWTMGEYAKAEPLYQRSLKIREMQLGPNHPDVARNLNNLACVHKAMGQYAKAEPLFQRALKIHEARLGPDHPDVASSLNYLAELYRIMGEYAKAEPLFQRSLNIREKQLPSDHPDVANAALNVALLYRSMGQYAKAEPLYQRGLKIYESKLGPDHPNVANAVNELASLYRQLGQYAKSEQFYHRSLKILESKVGPNHPDVAMILNNLASLYQEMGQCATAESLYRRSLQIDEAKYGPDHPEVASNLSNLANLYREMAQYEKAEPLYQRTIKIRELKLGMDHPSVAESLNGLALLYKEIGQYGKAEPLYDRSLSIRESKLGPDHPNVAQSLINMASLYAITERWSEAVTAIERERRIIRRHVARTLPALSEKEQLTFLQCKDETNFHLAMSLGLHERADAHVAQRSAGWILNGKAVAQEVLGQRALLASEGTNPALADLVKQLLDLRRQMASLSMTVPNKDQEAGHSERLNALGAQEQELSRQLGQATGQVSVSDPWVEPDAVRKSLAKDAILIDIARFGVNDFKARGQEKHLLPAHYVTWLIPAVGQGDITIIDLGEAQKIDTAVQAARKDLASAEATIRKDGESKAEKQLRDSMRDLAKLVFEPLQEHLGQVRKLIISPDAALWLVPWGALPLADGKYAIEKYQIRYCISGRDLVTQATNPGKKGNGPVLFANPDFDMGPAQAYAATRAVLRSAAPVEQVASSRGLGSLNSLHRVGRLPGTAEEAAAIKPNVTKYVGTEPVVYEDQYALEGVFKALHGPKLLVLSTHGFFMPDQDAAQKDDRASGLAGDDSQNRGAVLTTDGKPLENPLLRCGLLLAGCNQHAPEGAPSSADDGILTGLEIVGTDLRGTDLVVLSACETGLGQVRNGEGVAGLRQAFQLAGAKAVISTLWKIPDQETIQLMDAFFANLAAGQSKADALRNAQLAMIGSRRASDSASHPYYWAAFTLTGE